jgi:hypothetical protein
VSGCHIDTAWPVIHSEGRNQGTLVDERDWLVEHFEEQRPHLEPKRARPFDEAVDAW